MGGLAENFAIVKSKCSIYASNFILKFQAISENRQTSEEAAFFLPHFVGHVHNLTRHIY